MGAIHVIEEALWVTLAMFEFWPNLLPGASNHHHPPPLKGKRNELAMSLWCHRLKPHQKPRSEASYAANSGEPPPRAGHTTVRSAAPRPESPLAVHSPISAPD
jgi:hypothetical protein